MLMVLIRIIILEIMQDSFIKVAKIYLHYLFTLINY